MIIVPVDQRDEMTSEKFAYFDMIQIDDIKGFVAEMINEYGTEEKLFEANRVTDILVGMLKKRGLMNGAVQQSFVDILIASALLHNLFYDASDWTTIYTARKIMEPRALEGGIPVQVCDALFQTIEAQMGDDTPVPTSRPQPNTPTEVFAWAVWFAKEYEPQV